jgi:hypothetical protein
MGLRVCEASKINFAFLLFINEKNANNFKVMDNGMESCIET